MPGIEPDTSQAQLRARLPKEAQPSFFVILFIGLSLSIAGCATLLFLTLTPMFRTEPASAVPGFAIFTIVMAICALIARQCADFFATKKGRLVSLALCFICGALGPVGLFLGASVWWGALCISAIGCLCILYEWWSHLCSLEHRTLVFFVASTLLTAAIIVLVCALSGADSFVGAIVSSVLLAVSSVLLCLMDDGRRAALYAVDARESLNRVRSLAMRRLGEFSYFAVGIMSAVVVELISVMLSADPDGIGSISAVVFAIAAALIFAASTFGHLCKGFDLEGRSKDYLAFTCAIGFLPLPFASGVPQLVLLVYLLFIVGLQLTLVITAIIELARFEEISPLWYLGEATFLFMGMCIGSVMSQVCFLQLPEHGAIAVICVAAVIFISFAQVLFNKFSYPEIELFRSDDEQLFSRIGQKSSSDAKLAGEAADPMLSEGSGMSGNSSAESAKMEKLGLGEGDLQDEVSETEKLKGSMRFRNRIAEISEVYGLSPRQREILELLAKGRNSGYIMEHFHISRSTVKTHVYNIYIKLEIHSRQELLDLIESDEELIRPGYL